jgi:hypothetical protein
MGIIRYEGARDPGDIAFPPVQRDTMCDSNNTQVQTATVTRAVDFL